MSKEVLAVGSSAPQFEWLSEHSDEEVIVMFMGRTGRPNANGKTESLVLVKNTTTAKDTKICLVWDQNEQEVQAYKATVPGLIELSNVYDVYSPDKSIQINYKSGDVEGLDFSENDSVYGFPDYLIKNGKIIWAQENERFYKLSLVLRGWRP